MRRDPHLDISAVRWLATWYKTGEAPLAGDPWSRMSTRPSAKSMDVFSLRDAVVADYEKFAKSFTTIYADDIKEQVHSIYAKNRYWPEPLIQINPNYKRTTTIAKQVADNTLDPRCADIFQVGGDPLTLFDHQKQAIAIAAAGESYVVTTGTGSGKSLCFFIPIVDAILKEKATTNVKRTRAIVIYPMNALANSQLEELDKFVQNVVGERPVTFARYTGQEDAEERRRIADHPPDILLTNFMMLELLMTRQEEIDRKVIGNCAGLRFLVLDELHTYRGRQGADVAMLVRRVRERLAPTGLQCVGTSATMASEGSLIDKNRLVASVASKLFASQVSDANVITETLERVTDPHLTRESVRPKLGAAVDAGVDEKITDAALRAHPLAVWVETTLGVEWSTMDNRWQRARPLTVTQAVEALCQDAGRPAVACHEVLRKLLLISSIPERDRTGDDTANERSFFPFKLHQFISGAGHAFATLEAPGQRRVTVEGQQYLPEGDGSKRLYAVHFCRECGHEYHPVRLIKDGEQKTLLWRTIDDAPPAKSEDDEVGDDDQDADGEVFGFVTLHPPTPGCDPFSFTFADNEDDYPETWLEYDANQNPRLRPHYRKARPQRINVAPDGRLGSGLPAWFMSGKFRLCLRCGETHAGAARDRNRLASLTAEGRSSATTVLVNSVLGWMHGRDSGLHQHTRKLLGFTDNRQDAALQAGHFNDFLFVSLIRAAFLGALDAAGVNGLRSEEIGKAQQQSLGFDQNTPVVRGEWLLDPALKGLNLQDAEATLRHVLSYRVWFDQRRGWRFTNPNLEQLHLVRVEYRGLENLANDEGEFEKAPDVLRTAPPSIRMAVYEKVLDHLRKWMAIRSSVLEPTSIEAMLARSHSRLRTPWGFSIDEKPRGARWLMITPPPKKHTRLRDEDLIVRGGSRSALGRTLKATALWNDPAIRQLKSKDMDKLIHALLDAAEHHGLITKGITPFDNEGWQLNEGAVVFHRAQQSAASVTSKDNAFFTEFYSSLAKILGAKDNPLFGFEAREHTAQVEPEKRQVREKRFRYGNKEQNELADDEKHLVDIGESKRFLPVLFCSPTMELGVDISALNVVYLRNVPPTPANYAQRSGRAGRSGQAALVLSYASAQGPHDQYFFRRPQDMVHGEVKAPLLDLANQDLIDSHLQAVWLACTEWPLDPCIAELLVLDQNGRPLKADLREAMVRPEVTKTAVARMEGLLDQVTGELSERTAPWFTNRSDYAATVAASAPVEFDRAFKRWRDLFAAAEQQRDAARKTMDDYAAPAQEKRAAKSRHAQAIDQIELLQKSNSTQSSDFYTYRYLATEGFLPGYNFPRLPLMAYVPATNDGRGRQTYLQRPRFLALSEFGPRSLVYHEGRAFRVVRAMLSLDKDSASPDTKLPTTTIRICHACGGGHFDESVSMCHGCGRPLGDAEIVNNVFRIENVATHPAERITANDEERQRQGFELQTTFEWALRDQVRDVRLCIASDGAGDVLRLAYGPGATITRLNKGLRRRTDKKVLGFMIDPVSGYWAKDQDEDSEVTDPTAKPRQLVVPSVRDHKNALLVQPEGVELASATLATLQHAILRGIQTIYQLEEGELLAEAMPSRDPRNGFLLYEATEGGAGVLTRLVSEENAFAIVARRALEILHFDVPADVPAEPNALSDAHGTTCVAACYRCLMSYYNQPDHDLLDRRNDGARRFLLRLARSTTSSVGAQAVGTPATTASLGDEHTRWRMAASTFGVPAPDPGGLTVGSQTIPVVWRAHYVAAVFADISPETRSRLADQGFEVFPFDDEPTWPDAFKRLAAVLGSSK